MKAVRELCAMIIAFLGGSLILIALGHIQKSLFDLSQQQFSLIARTPVGYIIPFFAGGAIGLTIYLLCKRIHQLNSAASTNKTSLEQTTIKNFYSTVLAYPLIGIVVLALFSTIQKAINGYPTDIKGYLLPSLIGAISGLLIGLMQLRIYRLLHQEQQTKLFLQQQNDQTLDILASISDGLLVVDHSGHVTMVNDAAARMLDLPKGQIQGCDLVRVLTTATGSQDIDDNKINSIGAVNQFTITSGDGNQRSIKGTTSALCSNTSSNSRIMLLHDNTEEQHIDRMKSEFISSATHNLKTPITAITGYTELLLTQQNLPAEQTTEFLTYINDKAWELNTLVNNLLDINRAEAGRQIHLSVENTSVAPLIDHARRYCAAQKTPCQFSFDIQGADSQLSVDTHKINQVMENIIDNAIKFSPEGGHITIRGIRSSGVDAGNYQISISDEGVGMTQNQCLRIFDKFYRVDSSDSAQQGIGLGLTLAQNLIKAHNAEISVTSTLGRGTTLSFYLPISDTAEHAN